MVQEAFVRLENTEIMAEVGFITQDEPFHVVPLGHAQVFSMVTQSLAGGMVYVQSG